MINSLNIEALRLRVKNAVDAGIVVQNTLTYDDGRVLYRGWTFHDKPFGTGAVYWPNGQRYQEGLFGLRGLMQGAEYYPTGKIRFRGNFRAHRGYGPNPPVMGEFFDEEGNLKYSGEFTLHFGGVGYPTVEIPETYRGIRQHEVPRIDYFLFDEERELEQQLCESYKNKKFKSRIDSG